MRRALAALCLAVLACATNPVTGRREVMLMSPEREAELGREAAKQVAEEMGLVEDPALVAYLAQVGARVAAHSPRQDVRFRFFVAGMAETNAFALPGGYIYVSRGLLALARSEEELANVLAHEVGHVAARHAAQRETRAVGVGALSLLGAIAAGVLGGAQAAESVMQIGQVAGAGLIASYGRDQERQADDVGQKMAAAAGFDPGGMTSFLGALDREVTLRLGKPRMPTFLDSHPTTPERVAATGVLARQLGTRGGPAPLADRNAFVSHLAGLLVGDDPAEGVVRGETFLHPDLDLRLRFPSGWAVQNGRAAVGAQEPEGGALIVLQAQERGEDPRRAAERFLGANAQAIELVGHGSFEGASVPAYRARARVALQQGVAAGEFFWLALGGSVYRLQCLTAPQQLGAFLRSFERTAASFGRLSSEERASIREQRLEIVTAQAGETLEAAAERGGNVWRIEHLELANGLERGARLAAGQRIKIVVERPYHPRAARRSRAKSRQQAERSGEAGAGRVGCSRASTRGRDWRVGAAAQARSAGDRGLGWPSPDTGPAQSDPSRPPLRAGRTSASTKANGVTTASEARSEAKPNGVTTASEARSEAKPSEVTTARNGVTTAASRQG